MEPNQTNVRVIVMRKYIGRIVTIIYRDRGNRFTKRRIKILDADNVYIKAYCLERKAPRTLLAESVLAVEPVQPGKRRKMA